MEVSPLASRCLTRNYYSTYDVCKILGIDHKTYRRYEGKLFPMARRNSRNGFRMFSEEDVKDLKKIWNKRRKRKKRR
ncbi:MAG: MerR family transcriptional regulator [Candidatus Abyssobacteria bacterium SURF_17]|uniref:MerR family transcriptional regulator n=1 Tax=Candidatus Abyssobacteria bacterium SURF_17 TaxID=2093361 RepID=A0A419ERM7_9BACT|nr:MAG: MerR family transcriptional regulator [Candidatus Abyssubacteria bacterium SURF_17]